MKHHAIRRSTVFSVTILMMLSTAAFAQQTPVSASQTPADITAVNHVVFMLQENRSFDTYFGQLNPYRRARGWNVGDDNKTYDVDGIEDKVNKIYNEDDENEQFYLFQERNRSFSIEVLCVHLTEPWPRLNFPATFLSFHGDDKTVIRRDSPRYRGRPACYLAGQRGCVCGFWSLTTKPKPLSS